MRALLVCSALLTLAACHTLPPIAGFSASLRWQQQGVASDLLLRAPLGVGGAHLRFDGAVLLVTAGDGAQLEGAAARAELVRLLGFEPPLASLRYWLLGVPDPAAPAADETLDVAQRLAQLRQDGWQVDYGEYLRSASQWLPRRMVLQRGDLRLKLRVSNWQLP